MSERITYDGGDLIVTMHAKVSELESALNELASTGVAKALAERDYKMKLSEWSMRLKSDGYSGTMIDKVIYGIDKVAETRYQRDVAEVLYQVAIERINCTKLEIRVLDEQIKREYGRNGGGL